MSEFECKYGHLMFSSELYCAECLKEGRVEGKYRMDGLTDHQWRMMERAEARQEYEPEEEDYPE